MIAEIISTCTLVLCGGGLIFTWVRNGRNQNIKMAEMESRQNEQIKGIKEKLDDPITGLGAIKESVSKQETHCASITGRFDERVKNLEEGKRD